MPSQDQPPASFLPQSPNQQHLSLDLRIIVAILLAIIAAMLVMWRPWSDVKADDRTVSVTGEAKVTAEPDEYVFHPSYQFKNANRDAALSELSKKSDTVVAELKKLGVEDKHIKTNSGGYDYPVSREPDSGQTTYTLSLTITAGNKALAQKVQDYLLTTSPVGVVSPQASFSDVKRKDLESQARDQATKDARTKADQSAKNLGFKVGKVKSVSDGTGFGDVIPLGREGAASSAQDTQKLTLQPGQNDLRYSVTVVYYLK